MHIFLCLALRHAAGLARPAKPKVAALALEGTLVDVATTAGHSAAGDVAGASVIDTGALHKIVRVNHSGLGTSTDRENLGIILSLDSYGESEDGEGSDDLGNMFVWLEIVVSRRREVRISER